MKVTRRGLLAGAMALPAASGLAAWRWRHYRGTVVLYDPALAQAREFAEAEMRWNRPALAFEGDRIRFAREVLARRPQLVRGLSRQADAVLVGEVAAEEGYALVGSRVDGVLIDWTYGPRVHA